jgi:hypothetical protein
MSAGVTLRVPRVAEEFAVGFYRFAPDFQTAFSAAQQSFL